MKMSWLSGSLLSCLFFVSGVALAVVEDSNNSELKNCVMSVCYKVDGESFTPVSTKDNPDLVQKCLTQQSTTQTRWWVADVQVSSQSEALEFFKAQFKSSDYSFEDVVNGPIRCRSFDGITPFQKEEPTTYGVDVEVQIVEVAVPTSQANEFPVVITYSDNQCKNEDNIPSVRISPLDLCENVKYSRAKTTSLSVDGECLEIGNQTNYHACKYFRRGVPPVETFVLYHQNNCEGPTLYKTRSKTCTEMLNDFSPSLNFWENTEDGLIFIDSYKDYDGSCRNLTQKLSPEEACRLYGE